MAIEVDTGSGGLTNFLNVQMVKVVVGGCDKLFGEGKNQKGTQNKKKLTIRGYFNRKNPKGWVVGGMRVAFWWNGVREGIGSWTK